MTAALTAVAASSVVVHHHHRYPQQQQQPPPPNPHRLVFGNVGRSSSVEPSATTDETETKRIVVGNYDDDNNDGGRGCPPLMAASSSATADTASSINRSNNMDCCRLLNGDVLGSEFHTLFKAGVDQNRRKNKRKKSKKKTKAAKGKDKQKTKVDGTSDSVSSHPPIIEVCSNPSLFAVFAGVRQSVLEKQIRDAAQIFLAANTSQSTDSEEEEDDDDKSKDVVSKIPKVVGVGLCSVFVLILESRQTHPSLCTRALEALLDIIQGQQPEGLKSEPSEVIDSLFDLLLELASQQPTSKKGENNVTVLTSVACSCLLSLVVARGDTGKLLRATAAMLMSHRSLATEDLKMPSVLTALQRSVHAVLLGKTIIPDWVTNGVLKKGLIDSFVLNLPEDKDESCHYSMASDGRFLYLFSSTGNLYKVGTGYGGSIRGHVYAHKSDFHVQRKGWLGFASSRLYFKTDTSSNILIVMDQSTLNETDTVVLEGKDSGPSVTFSDGENIGTITSGKDDSFAVRTYSPAGDLMPCISELPLKLARKCLDLFGWASFDEEMSIHTITNSFDDEPTFITAGKEFALMRTVSGKVLYSGKAQSLGIKQGGGVSGGRWVELPVTKSPKIVNVSVGHDGLHALLVAEDGSVFFVGTARRGEDGDQNKGRRQPKPVKPKKLIKVESMNIASSACNNGTSALLTRDGELYMFGKDTIHCHHTTGLVNDLKDTTIVQVALGKAHVVALSSKGHVYTFGINNKGQCGRDFATHPKDTVMTVAMATTNEDDLDDEELEAEEPEIMCPPGQHKWKQDECMVCTVCGECTGFGVSCISKGQPDRSLGLPCGCGWGDSGCSECGCCKTCAGESKVLDSILAAELDVIVRRRPGNRLQDQIQRKLDERRHRHKSKFGSKSLKMKTVRSHVVDLPQDKPMVAALVDEVVSSDQEREASKISSLPPARVMIACDSSVTNIACGVHHTVLLTQNGEVFTFGSNQHGQLGVGDLTPRGVPTLVRLPSSAVHIAAGSNHTVILTVTGLVYSFGSYQKGQLGRMPPQPNLEARKEKLAREAPWFSVPGAVPNIGPKHGRRPTWVGASGDQTFLKIDESLINAHNLTHSTIAANKNSICLIPTVASTFKCLLISKLDGNCRSFNGTDQVDLSNHCACLDSAYNTIWSFNPASSQVCCYNVVAAEARNVSFASSSSSSLFPSSFESNSSAKTMKGESEASVSLPMPHILNPMLATPIQPHYCATRSQAALHLLACLDTLAMAQELHWRVEQDETDHQTVSKTYNKEDFSSVNRFESHGGGWGYSGHSIEAIRFMADTDLLIGGFGLFGGRGEYTGKIKLFDIGMEGGDQEIDGELLAETEEVPYECGARQKYPMLFDEPISLQANRWYVAWARVSGPSSDCGSSGQSLVTTDDQVAFYFKSSKKSNNGTDVNAGQIPQLLYRVVAHESQTTNYKSDAAEPVYVLSREFSRTVTPFCLQSLLQLLEWSWITFKTTVTKVVMKQDIVSGCKTDVLDLERLVYISCASLRLLRTYINEVYPNSAPLRKCSPEVLKLVECVADTRSLLRHILSDPLPVTLPPKKLQNNHKLSKVSVSDADVVVGMVMAILDECHITFVACFHAFYPTSQLKWACLCDLLVSMDSSPMIANGCDHLLAAILASLCSPTIKLTAILPILCEVEDSSPRKSSAPGGITFEVDARFVTDLRYPVLVEHMIAKSQLEEGCNSPCSFRDVLDRLLAIVVRPVKKVLGHEKVRPSTKLVSNTCSLLAAIVAELAAQTTGLDADLHTNGGRILHCTPSRFTRTSQSRSWNTGNGSPDAICFSVDRPGIVVSGVCLYGGVGTYDYELEILDDQNGSNSDPSHTQRWNSLEVVRGTFGPDDCASDITEVKFERPVSLKENAKYAIRLRNHGGRTSNGDGGLNSVKGTDGTTFTFSACSLSFNGTNQTRGQIPQILYYSTPQDSDSQQNSRAVIEMQARKSALSIAASIIRVATTLLQQARDESDDDVLEALASSHVTSMLLPMVLAHVAPIATSDPRSAVQVLEMIQDILPPVAHLSNRFQLLTKPPQLVANEPNVVHDNHLSTTSNHYAVVESEHPYRPATVATFRVCFPESVRWMSLEFDPQCGTSQSEDALQLYVPSKKRGAASLIPRSIDDDEEIDSPFWPVLQKFSGCNSWPRCSVILPGNEVLFSLETASDYVKDEKACFYGFKCTLVGYEWSRAPEEELKHLEDELSYLGGMCASSLMKKDLLLPPASVDEMEEDLDVVDEIAHQVHSIHSNLLSKGFALSYPPTIHQALEGVLPFSYLSNERSFLKDFVLCASGTSGGRLARWLQPDSYVDPKHCEVLYSKDEMRCGWPTVVTVVTKDQYEEIVNVPNLKLEVKAVPVDKRDRSVEDSNRKFPRISKPDLHSFGGYPLPNITIPYEVTVKDKMCYYAISMMKAYENYSFEELRYTTPALKRPSENMMVRANNDGTYSCNWTPSSVGCYLVCVSIDGFEIENTRKVEVKDPPQGVVPPSQTPVKKSLNQPTKVKKFVAKYSAGLRVRAHPSLQSEQIGIVHVNGVITFIDEVHNDDGVWVRLNAETIKTYCHNVHSEAWCLQYNQHLGRTLLVPIEEPKTFSEEAMRRTRMIGYRVPNRERAVRQRTEGPGIYNVVKCGASGHNIRCGPSLKSPPVGMLVMGNQFNVVEYVINSEGSWVKLDKDSVRQFCFNADTEGWSLAQSRCHVTYLRHENDTGTNLESESDRSGNMVEMGPEVNGASPATDPNKQTGFALGSATSLNDSKPFDFSMALQNPLVSSFAPLGNQSQGVFTFGHTNGEHNRKLSFSDSTPPPFVFGPAKSSPSPFMSQGTSSPPTIPPKPLVPDRRQIPHPPMRSTSVLQKWLHSEDHSMHRDTQISSPPTMRESSVPPELVGVSVKELVKVLGESRANGNESTPPQSPPNTPPRPRRLSRSSSPKVHGSQRSIGSHETSPIPIPGSKFLTNSNDSIGSSPSVCSIQSSMASPQIGSSPSSLATPPPFRRGSAHGSSRGSGSPMSASNSTLHCASTVGDASDSCLKSFAQAGTQTSPDGLVKGHFSIGSGTLKEEPIRLSPKMPRKDRTAARQLRSKRERAQSPASLPREHAAREYAGKKPVKNAMSPLVADCLRTVFASFLWHEGLVHDAMACASFLKFHPDLPKQLPKVPKQELPAGKPEVLSKEQKARLRHSVEVSASNFLSIQPSTAEAFARSLANANVNKNKLQMPTETIKEEITGADGKNKTPLLLNKSKGEVPIGPLPSGISSTAVHSLLTCDATWSPESTFLSGDLPPSLQHLLVLWEGLTMELLKVISQQLTLPMPALPLLLSKGPDGKDKDSDRKGRKKKEWRLSTLAGRANLFCDASRAASGGPFGGQERETVCELCGSLFPHPVTYHMRQAHPGCGGHAGGKGYNSGGNFCGGWAGNCGDGGVGGSSWYLICDRCRERYLRQKRQVSLKEKSRKTGRKVVTGKMLSPLPPMETHQIMKQNATFLLDLASASGMGIAYNAMSSANKKSPHGAPGSSMPIVSEHSPLEPTLFQLPGFQCLQMLGAQQGEMCLLGEDFLLEESLRQGGSSVGGGGLGGNRGAEDFGVLTLHSLSENEGCCGTSGGEGQNESVIPRGRMFHRSISVGTTTREWNREEGEKRVIMTRKRNKSSGEGVDGSSLLCHPSPTLTKLVSLATDKSNLTGGILSRPIMAFILQRHDLLSLRLAMKQAVRKAACRAYAMQGLNWLIRSVTQPTALHDLLWFFVAALTPTPDYEEEETEEEGGAAAAAAATGSAEKKEKRDHDKEKDVGVCDHPLSDITIAGDAVCPLVSAFHALLQSISDLMMMLPMGSSLQQMAMRCWCLKFRQSDHIFLHRSHVFSNISKILSRSEEELPGDGDGTSSMGDSFQQSTSTVECLKDLSSSIEVKASSRPGMLGSLVDNSTETFWESGDEDRNKAKVLTITCPSNSISRIVYVHVDNCRDLGNKVSSISFKVGSNVDELVKLRQMEVESRYAGWVSCPITVSEGRPLVIRLEFKGPDNTLRVRQVKVLGEVEGESVRVGKPHSAVVLQQRNCEAETLKVFRLLTSLVFGRLILNDAAVRDEKGASDQIVANGANVGGVTVETGHSEDYQKAEGSNDLKEHMVGILFSRSKLTHLQKQVCTHIVQAIRKEAARVRDEWEALLCSKSLSMEELPKSSDAYCFEMLSMVLALSGSSVGRAYVAQQYTLLTDLLSLLHTGSARVQRQVTSLLRRVLPDVSPQTFAQILGVKSLPPTDYSIVSEASKTLEGQDPPFDVHRMGILDVFFSCIAKALTVQMKVKGKETNKGITSVTLATSIHPRDFMGSRWWLRGCITRKLAEVIIQLLQDMAAGRLSDAWASITKGAVAENILNLTKLSDNSRGPTSCLKTPTLWLALSSLCVLDQDHVERLSSGQWAGNGDGQQVPSRPICDNHDDGETLAIILCSLCGNMCADCDRYLHLHRRTRTHQRQVFKEEEEAIRVDLHEGCGRTKLFWIMALADSKTLKAMVEFREGARGKSTTTAAGTCRFCGSSGESGLLAIGNVCGDSECQEHARTACTKSLSCGHICGGIRNETCCLPCLHGCSNDSTLKQDADDMCMICFTEALSCAPAVQLRCGHVFHLHCCRNVLMKRWAGPRITFGFSLCPICKSIIDHAVLRELLDPVRNLYDDVRRKALMRLEYEGIHKAEAITTPGARFFSDPAGYAMERYAYYVCYKCKKAYYGGEARCDIDAGGGDDYDPTELVCGACSDISRAQMCPKHGTDFLEYKCRYCCSVAVFFCFGTTHFCNACHDDFQHVTNIPKHELPHCPAGPKGKQMEGEECPLHIQHPATGEEFALGCGVCRNAHTF